MEKKNCKDLGVSQDLMKFVKILMPKSLKNFIIFFFIKKRKEKRENSNRPVKLKKTER
jgi:hypothetical protein